MSRWYCSEWICGAAPTRPPSPGTVSASVSQQHSCIVSITGIRGATTSNSGRNHVERGIGVVVHPTLILTTHSTIPSPACIQDAEIVICRDIATLSYVKRKFVPEIFFQTDADLDLTVVSCELIAPALDTLALDTTKLSRRALRKGHNVFLMGCHVKEPEDVVIIQGKIVGVEKSNKLKTHFRFQTGEGLWMPGSAGFDEFGTFSFIVSKPRKLQDQEALAGRSPKQWASCIQVVKDWVKPLWMINRDAVFQGPQPASPAICASDGAKRPNSSFHGDPATPKRESMIETSVESSAPPPSIPIRQAIIPANKAAESQPAEPTAAPPTKKLQTTTKSAAAVEAERENPIPASERSSPKTAKASPKGARKKPTDEAATREQRAKREVFAALKTNKGVKRLADKATRTTDLEHETDSVSVQTELFVMADADVKPVIILSRPATPEPGLRPAGDPRGGRKGQRERWSLPADGHAPDLLNTDNGEDPMPRRGNRRVRASEPMAMEGYNAGRRSVSMTEADSTAPAWMDKYFARGRSRSELPSRASSAGSTPPRPRRQVVSDAEAEADEDDTTSVSGSSSQPLQRADSAYFKPTISYMQKRNVNQRDSILARQASQTAVPRWS